MLSVDNGILLIKIVFLEEAVINGTRIREYSY